jgi:hypothetical protein
VLGLLKTTGGILRSLRIYYGNRTRASGMDRLYGQFIKDGDLVFDVGSHVGDRAASFSRLGARVVAVEPTSAMGRGTCFTPNSAVTIGLLPSAGRSDRQT